MKLLLKTVNVIISYRIILFSWSKTLNLSRLHWNCHRNTLIIINYIRISLPNIKYLPYYLLILMHKMYKQVFSRWALTRENWLTKKDILKLANKKTPNYCENNILSASTLISYSDYSINRGLSCALGWISIWHNSDNDPFKLR